jgi:hypothetical protein
LPVALADREFESAGGVGQRGSSPNRSTGVTYPRRHHDEPRDWLLRFLNDDIAGHREAAHEDLLTAGRVALKRST